MLVIFIMVYGDYFLIEVLFLFFLIFGEVNEVVIFLFFNFY